MDNLLKSAAPSWDLSLKVKKKIFWSRLPPMVFFFFEHKKKDYRNCIIKSILNPRKKDWLYDFIMCFFFVFALIFNCVVLSLTRFATSFFRSFMSCHFALSWRTQIPVVNYYLDQIYFKFFFLPNLFFIA